MKTSGRRDGPVFQPGTRTRCPWGVSSDRLREPTRGVSAVAIIIVGTIALAVLLATLCQEPASSARSSSW
jgi:hypothetical protein